MNVLMETEVSSLPPIGAYPSPGIAEAVLEAAEEAGIRVEIRGDALLESADGVAAALHFDLTPWLPYLQAAAGAGAVKVIDGAVAEIGAEGLHRFARMARAAVDRAVRKPFVDAVLHYGDRVDRAYHLPGRDTDAAAVAILQDVGLAAEHPLDRARFWDEGRWIGGKEWNERERQREPMREDAGSLPRRETFAALDDLRALFGAEVRYVSRGHDIGIMLPNKPKGETVEEGLFIIRRHLPNNAVGLDSTRKMIVVENALEMVR
jgi:hypothetical protein